MAEFLKSITVEQWTLIVAVITLLATLYGIWKSGNGRKREMQSELDEINDELKNPFLGATSLNRDELLMRKSILERRLGKKKKI